MSTEHQAKRGRPLSEVSSDPRVQKRREVARKSMAKLRALRAATMNQIIDVVENDPSIRGTALANTHRIGNVPEVQEEVTELEDPEVAAIPFAKLALEDLKAAMPVIGPSVVSQVTADTSILTSTSISRLQIQSSSAQDGSFSYLSDDISSDSSLNLAESSEIEHGTPPDRVQEKPQGAGRRKDIVRRQQEIHGGLEGDQQDTDLGTTSRGAPVVREQQNRRLEKTRVLDREHDEPLVPSRPQAEETLDFIPFDTDIGAYGADEDDCHDQDDQDGDENDEDADDDDDFIVVQRQCRRSEPEVTPSSTLSSISRHLARKPRPHGSVTPVSRSTDDDENNEFDDRTDLAKLTDIMVRQFTSFQGCTAKQHRQWLADHNAHVANSPHNALDEILFQDQVSKNHRLATINTETKIPDPKVLHRKPDLTTLLQVMTGIEPSPNSDTEDKIKFNHVCLEKSKTSLRQATVAGDIDSFMGIAQSLDFAKQGLIWQPIPLMKQALKTDIKLQMDYYKFYDDSGVIRCKSRMMKNVPHIYLGHVKGAEEIKVFLFFPQLHHEGTEFTALTKVQMKRLLDCIILPAIDEVMPDHVKQHYISSWEIAWRNTFARNWEKTMGTSNSKQTTNTYCIESSYLREFWDSIVTKINRPGNEDFKGVQIFLNAKNTKLHHKSPPGRPSMLGAIEVFERFLPEVVRTEHIDFDQFYVDVGREVCPQLEQIVAAADISGEDDSDDEPPRPVQEAQVYLWRRCCLQRIAETLHLEIDGKSRQEIYYQNMLRDSVNMTLRPGKRSATRKAGLIYSQFYNSIKETMDPGGNITPFDYNDLELLAIDTHKWETITSTISRTPSNHASATKAYTASKLRARAAMEDSSKKCFGIREEHRISWALLQSIKEKLLESAPSGDVRAQISRPSHVWAIRTNEFNYFVLRNMDRFSTAFEVARAAAGDRFSYEKTKVMSMLLRCLPYSASAAPIHREGALWWQGRQLQVRGKNVVRYGIGFGHTLEQYGFCWLAPIVDWSSLTFKKQYEQDVLFNCNKLMKRFHKGNQKTENADLNERAQFICRYFDRGEIKGKGAQKVLEVLVHLVLRQFRIDVLDVCSKDERRDGVNWKEAMEGGQPFCLDFLASIFCDMYIVDGNRSDSPPKQLYHRYFSLEPEFVQWRGFPRKTKYLIVHQTVYDALEKLGSFSQQSYIEQLEAHFWRHHPVMPMPEKATIAKTSAKSKSKKNTGGHRAWAAFALDHRGIPIRQSADAHKAANKTRSSLVELPEHAHWSNDELLEFLVNRNYIRPTSHELDQVNDMEQSLIYDQDELGKEDLELSKSSR